MGRVGSATCRLGHGMTRGWTCGRWTVATIGARERFQLFVTVDDPSTHGTSLQMLWGREQPRLTCFEREPTFSAEVGPPRAPAQWRPCAERPARATHTRAQPRRAVPRAKRSTLRPGRGMRASESSGETAGLVLGVSTGRG